MAERESWNEISRPSDVAGAQPRGEKAVAAVFGDEVGDQRRMIVGRFLVHALVDAAVAEHEDGEPAPAALASVWTGETTPQTPLATIQSTIGLALLAMGRADDPADAMNHAASIWARRR